jgi:hypothetical protein
MWLHAGLPMRAAMGEISGPSFILRYFPKYRPMSTD